MTDFTTFGLSRPIMAALVSEGHETPTPIQERAIPALLEGHDLLGLAQTGTGKTAAFALPILHRLFEKTDTTQKRRPGPRALVLAPTRELAGQVKERFHAYGAKSGLKFGLVIGGAPMGKQKAMLRSGVDVLVATPGRLDDLMKQKALSLDHVETLVLDEVDQMLDMGFIHAIRKICAALPKERQSVFFSATMPRDIARLADALLRDPVRVEIEAAARPKITQSVQFMSKPEKPRALIQVARMDGFENALVFSRTKHGADKIVRILNQENISAQAIHGNRNQGQRERALRAFKRGEIQILVATDIAARGIDIKGVSHVINYDLPNVPETYVHRIGRTARAGASGIAISFCDNEERAYLKAIERLTGEKIAGERPQQGDDRKPAKRVPYRGNAKPDRARQQEPAKKRRPQNRRPAKAVGEEPKQERSAHEREADNVIAGLSFMKDNNAKHGSQQNKGKQDGERRTPRIRRRRRRSAA